MHYDEEKVTAVLLRRRAEVVEASGRAVAERRPVELDQQSVGRLSRMDAIQMRQMALAAERNRQVELQRIDSALRRLDAGEFGLCVGCGEEIAERRLQLDPATPSCFACARGAG